LPFWAGIRYFLNIMTSNVQSFVKVSLALPRRIFLEPINTITHLIGVVGSVYSLFVLVSLTRNDASKMISMIIYGGSLISLFSVSSLLHGVKTTRVNRMMLNRLDHAAIFLLIGGTYTPIAFNIFPDSLRWSVLSTVWIIVVIGMVFKLRSAKIHGFLNTFIYLVLGWGSAVPLILFTDLIQIITFQGIFLLLLGGLIFTIGFLIYYFKWPDPWPDVFGHHEIWHLFVLGGTVCHFFFILFTVVPFERR